jgi:hypothetical protein
MSKFEEHGRMFVRGKTVKLRFNIPESDDLAFFCMREDVERLLDNRLEYVRIFLDQKEVTV